MTIMVMVAVAVALAVVKWNRPSAKKSLGIVFLVHLVCQINCGLLQSAHKHTQEEKTTILNRWWKKEPWEKWEIKSVETIFIPYTISHSEFAIGIQVDREKENDAGIEVCRKIKHNGKINGCRQDQAEALHRWHSSFTCRSSDVWIAVRSRHLHVIGKIAGIF